MVDVPGQALPITLQHKANYSKEENIALDAHRWGFCGHEVRSLL